MTPARDLLTRADQELLQQRCHRIREALVQDGLYDAPVLPAAGGTEAGETRAGMSRWRISPHPFLLSPQDLAFFQSLGPALLAFYRALNRLYQESVRGTQPGWVQAYLDQGKPEDLIAFSRMNRFRDHLPAVIRPDIIPTEAGMVITELDSVPGGMGLTGALARAFDQANHPPYSLVGGVDGMVQGFAAMVRGQLVRSGEDPENSIEGCLAIVVSEEAKDYRPEMEWLAARLQEQGLETYCLDPKDILFTEDGLLASTKTGTRPVALLYRFFELFDLKNVPKAELVMYAAKKGRVAVTPPFKPALEEKLAFALLHHPVLAPFWKQELGEDTFVRLSSLMPRTWVLDPRPLPPTAVIPDMRVGNRAIADWQDLTMASQKERRLVVKPSGFSELAWGSRGVSVGHDLPQTEWAAALDHALASFPRTPYILQEFHKGRQFDLSYYNERAGEVVPMAGRARLSPYYFVTGDRAELAGILATVCPLDKKLLHGMRDAIMVPCAVAPGESKSQKV